MKFDYEFEELEKAKKIVDLIFKAFAEAEVPRDDRPEVMEALLLLLANTHVEQYSLKGKMQGQINGFLKRVGFADKGGRLRYDVNWENWHQEEPLFGPDGYIGDGVYLSDLPKGWDEGDEECL